MLLGALVASACGHDEPPRAPDAPRPGPVAPSHSGANELYSFALEPPEIDLGELRPDEDAHFEFAIVNHDARPLKVVNLDGSCECVSFTWNRADIPPGGRTVVKTDVRAQNRGTKLLTAYVQVNDRLLTTKQVAIRYAVLSDLAFDPPRADFGRRVAGSPTAIDVVISYRIPKGSEPIVLAPQFTTAVPVTVTIDPVPEVVERADWLREVRSKMRLELDTSHAAPAFESELVFTSDRHVKSRLVVTGSVHQGIYLDVEQLHLGVVAAGEKRRGTARLLWTRGDPKILKLECEPPELTASAVREEGARAFRILIELTAPASGEFDGVVRIRTDAFPEPLLLSVKAKIR